MKDLIDAPPEFKKLARAFYQGSRREVANEEEWIESALRHLDRRSKDVVRQFLTDLLSRHPEEYELQSLWNSAGSGYYIADRNGHEGVRIFLTMIKNKID